MSWLDPTRRHGRPAGMATTTEPPTPRDRARLAAPFLIVGVACVIVGGVTAAVTAHASSEHATWASAYLVLVAGVAQGALGVGQAQLVDQCPTPRRMASELISWNLGNGAVIAGTVIGTTLVVDVGGGLLGVALVLFAVAARGRRGWLFALYRAVIVIVLVSIPIGLILAAVEAS